MFVYMFVHHFVDCDTDGYVETGSPPHLLAFKSKWVGDPD